jgi:hypothetical protein
MTLGKMTLGKTMLGKMTLGKTTLGKMTLGEMPLVKPTFYCNLSLICQCFWPKDFKNHA